MGDDFLNMNQLLDNVQIISEEAELLLNVLPKKIGHLSLLSPSNKTEEHMNIMALGNIQIEEFGYRKDRYANLYNECLLRYSEMGCLRHLLFLT